MEKFRVEGGIRLTGRTRVHCAKNAVLPILAGAILADDPVTLLDCPDIADVNNMVRILHTLGCTVRGEGSETLVDAATIQSDACRRDYPSACVRLYS